MMPEPKAPVWLNRLVARPARLWVALLLLVALFAGCMGGALWGIRIKRTYTVTPAVAGGGSWRVALPRARWGRLLPGAAWEMTAGERTFSGAVTGVSVQGDTLRVTLASAEGFPDRVPAGTAQLTLRYPSLVTAFLR